MQTEGAREEEQWRKTNVLRSSQELRSTLKFLLQPDTELWKKRERLGKETLTPSSRRRDTRGKARKKEEEETEKEEKEEEEEDKEEEGSRCWSSRMRGSPTFLLQTVAWQ